ncbi:MAG: FAD-dependent oxidoreductase [Pseudomonadota bacterium]
MIGKGKDGEPIAADVAIIGAGIIGLSCAWELARRGVTVSIYDKDDPTRGASWAAAGMIAPGYEAASEDDAHPFLLELCLASAKLWPGFANDLEDASGIEVGFHPGPTIAVSTNPGQTRRLEKIRTSLGKRGIDCSAPPLDELRELEPLLSGGVQAGLVIPTDGRVNNRLVLEALASACKKAGVVFHREHVPGIAGTSRASLPNAPLILWAGGFADSASPEALPALEAMYGVRGEMIAFDHKDIAIHHVIRCGKEYAVPRNGQTLIGATTKEEADPQSYLKAAATMFLQGVDNASIIDSWGGCRPATPDHAPLLGKVATSTFAATGHYRNGILLAPITAQIMADMILDNKVSELAAAFSPDRFATVS